MCPVCITTTAVTVAAAGSTGGILAVCLGTFPKVVQRKGRRTMKHPRSFRSKSGRLRGSSSS